MKKLIAIIMAAIMLLSLCACAKDTDNGTPDNINNANTQNNVVDSVDDGDNAGIESDNDADNVENDPTDDVDTDDTDNAIGIIGGADGPTAIIVADPSELPERVEWEETFIGGDYAGFYRTFTAYAADGSVMWTYKTGNSMAAQLETLEYIGMYDGLVYINEQSLYDEDLNAEGMIEIYGRLRALDARTGEVVWDNTDYDGGSSAWDFDEEGNLYIGGYFGPDCIKIGTVGETIWKVDSADSDAFWMYSLEYKDGEIALSYEMNDLGEEETVILSAENGEKLR